MILILGATGYIGTAFRQCLDQRSIAYRAVSRREVDCADRDQLQRLIADCRPEFLINAAGFVGRPNVDACELQKTECLQANAVLPGIIREVCEERQLPWGHVSAGCLFTGESPHAEGFRETDEPNFTFRQNNCSFYSGSKALGEELLANAQQCFVWRMRMPFEANNNPQNYIGKLLRYPQLLDVRNSLSHLGECISACVDCWTQRVEFGTYHLNNGGSMTTRDIVERIQKLGLSTKEFTFYSSIEAFEEEAVTTPRSFCVLDNRKATDAGLRLRHVQDAIEDSIRNWQD
jgi:UDP-glucose 4,6-dehydratase